MSEAASATIFATTGSSQYTATLNDTGSTSIGTFWFAWVPGEDFLDVSPTNIVSPAGWTAVVTHSGAGDGFAIQWKATSSASDLQSGASLSGFGFTSSETPAQLSGNSPFFSSTPELTSFTYTGAPFSDAGFDFVAALDTSTTQSNGNIAVAANATETVNGNDDHITAGHNANLTIDGNGDTVRARPGASIGLTGTGEGVFGAGFAVSASSGSQLLIGRNGATGVADTVTASNTSIEIAANSNIILNGDDDTVMVRQGSHLDFTGVGLTAHVAANANITINGKGEGGALDTLSGANFGVTVANSANVELDTLGATATLADNVALSLERANNSVHAGNSDTISILWGDSNQVLLGQNDVITDGGSGSTFQAGGNVGATTIKTFGADPGGIVELLNGVGGYQSSSDAFNALASDGAGGLMLSLGANGSIDFAGDTSLSAANFKIG